MAKLFSETKVMYAFYTLVPDQINDPASVKIVKSKVCGL